MRQRVVGALERPELRLDGIGGHARSGSRSEHALGDYVDIALANLLQVNQQSAEVEPPRPDSKSIRKSTSPSSVASPATEPNTRTPPRTLGTCDLDGLVRRFRKSANAGAAIGRKKFAPGRPIRVEALADSSTSRARRRDHELRLDDIRCAIALLEADLVTALQYIEGRGRLVPTSDATAVFEQRFPILAARVMLAARQRDAAERWIRVAEQIPGPGIVRAVTVPTLRAWHEWLFGRLDLATKLIDEALTWMDDHFIGAHHHAFDTLITAGWCRLSAGDLTEAAQLARRAQYDADILDCAWNHLQAGFLSARLAMVTGDPDAALRTIEDVRSRIVFDSCRPYTDRILGLEVEALAAAGADLQDLAPLIDALEPGPRRQLLRARFVTREADDVDDDLADCATWPVTERLQAELIIASRTDVSRRPARFEQLIAQCAETGWVLPFLGMGPQVDRLLRSDSVEQLHPRLARALAQFPSTNPTRASIGDGVRLTNRELGLLELLPTHLSYAEMGNRLYLSVNTIKTNLKNLYRKLNASTRTQAVETGRGHGLI